MGSSNCDTCAYNVYDEEDACYYYEVILAVKRLTAQYKIMHTAAWGNSRLAAAAGAILVANFICCEDNRDEDDMIRVVQEHYKNCPYYKNGDEYAVVKKQI